ncbi:MAG: hypothetical protein QG650_85 [Patescibacteria group bacterium]|nr:hypothetical protein [Patescibacteria group bacterium]
MDWKALKNKAVSFGNKAVDAGASVMEKASARTYDGLRKTSASLKNGSELDVAKSIPLLVVIVIGKDDAASKTVLGRVPMIYGACMGLATPKFILSDEVPELVAALAVSEVPTVLIYRKGELEKRFDGLAALDFLKDINLSKPKAEAAPVPEGMTDVLAQAVAPQAPIAPIAPAVPVAAPSTVPVAAVAEAVQMDVPPAPAPVVSSAAPEAPTSVS